MTVTLQWLLQQPTLPEPEAPAFVQPSAKPGASTGDLALGCGIIAPFQRDGKGDFLNGCGIELIQASIARILGINAMTDTTHGDLEWRPEFGSLIDRIRHARTIDPTGDLARYYVIDALRIWEPRIAVRDATVEFVERQEPGSPPGYACEIRILYDILGQKRGTSVLIPGVNQLVTLQQAA